jgi:hypothetical protein
MFKFIKISYTIYFKNLSFKITSFIFLLIYIYLLIYYLLIKYNFFTL